MAFNTVTVGTTATKIVDANSLRQSLLIENEGSVTVFLGPDNTVTTANGIGLRSCGTIAESNDGTKIHMDAYWGIVESGTADVRYWERTRK